MHLLSGLLLVALPIIAVIPPVVTTTAAAAINDGRGVVVAAAVGCGDSVLCVLGESRCIAITLIALAGSNDCLLYTSPSPRD